MIFKEIQKITGNFRLPYWHPGKYIKVNYNERRRISHLHAIPTSFHMEIINDSTGETCAIEFDSKNGWTLTEEDLRSSEWCKLEDWEIIK